MEALCSADAEFRVRGSVSSETKCNTPADLISAG